MSATKQHYLPQFFLRGFLANEEAEQVYVFRKDKNPFCTSIENVGAQCNFYTFSDEDLTLDADESITLSEDQFADIVREFRNIENSHVSCDKAAKLVVHLAVRNKHFRLVFNEAVRILIERLHQEGEESESTLAALGFKEGFRSPKLKEQIVDSILERAPNLSRDQAEKLYDENQNYISQEFYKKDAEIWKFLSKILGEAILELPELSKKTHVNSLNKSTAPEKRVNILSELEWFIFSYKENIILGDVGPIACTNRDPEGVPYIFTGEDVYHVFMPISSNTILVGSLETNWEFNLDNFNNLIAGHSMEFFISSSYTSIEENLRSTINSLLYKYLYEKIYNIDIHE